MSSRFPHEELLLHSTKYKTLFGALYERNMLLLRPQSDLKVTQNSMYGTYIYTDQIQVIIGLRKGSIVIILIGLASDRSQEACRAQHQSEGVKGFKKSQK